MEAERGVGLLQSGWLYLQSDRVGEQLARFDIDLGGGDHLQTVGAFDQDAVTLIGLPLVRNLQGENVLDQTGRRGGVQLATVTNDIHLERHAITNSPDEGRKHDQQSGKIANQSWPQQLGLVSIQGVLGGVAYQSRLVTYPLHHIIAGIDTGAAGDALIL